jgi:hypothetical protein
MKHKHAENMIAYAQDAMETECPMERWEFKHVELSEWRDCTSTPTWRYDCEYRRKPRTININGFEVPKPVREPLQNGKRFYVADIFCQEKYWESTWRGYDLHLRALREGIIHLTREAAELHAKALLSFTENP